MKKIEGGVTAAAGFQAASVAAGIKYKERPDMAMIFSPVPCHAAGAFTRNVVKAAPVKWDQQVVRESDFVQAVVINAGIANACTGAEGFGYCHDTAKAASEVLGISKEAVLVASTGVIGMQLPMNRIQAGIEQMASLLKGAALTMRQKPFDDNRSYNENSKESDHSVQSHALCRFVDSMFELSE